MTATKSPYQWIIDRARAGEPVPIDTTRRDINRVVDFLRRTDGHGLTIQDDAAAGLLWVVRSDALETTGCYREEGGRR